VKRCEVAYFDQPSCDANAACLWDAANSVCKKSCQYLFTENDCRGVGGSCEWVSTRRLCQKKCGAAAKDNVTCTTAPLAYRCAWDNTNSLCAARCNTTMAQGSCLSDSRCAWDAINRQCYTQCSKVPMGECAGETRCVARTVSMVPMCLMMPELRDTTRADCENDPMGDTMWDPRLLLCRTTCSLLAPADCGTVAMCRVLPDGNCTKRCQYGAQNQPACSADATCWWDAQRQICTEKCGAITSPVECDAHATCQFRDGSCQQMCGYVYNSTQATLCNADNACYMSTVSEVCENTCSKHVGANRSDTELRCAADLNCRFNATTGICQNGCRLKGLFACNADSRCIWDPTQNFCLKTCDRMPSQVACTVQSTVCVYDDPSQQCEVQCRLQYSTEESCKSVPSKCLWDSAGAFCKPACGRYGSSALCLGNPECEWVGFRCRLQCGQRSVATCNVGGDLRCALFSPGYLGDQSKTSQWCMLSCSAKYASQAQCVTDVNCMWSQTKGQCVRGCGRGAYEGALTSGSGSLQDACLAQTGCTWYNQTQVCGASCLEAYADAVSCDANLNCRWDHYRSKCTQKCALLGDKGRCVAAGHCDWVDSLSKCQPQCPYRHFTFENCSADASCQWDTPTATCVSKCVSSLQGGACTDHSVCEFNSTQNVCQASCEARCFTPACCQTYNDCLYDATSGQCKKTCMFRTPSSCQLVPAICIYNDVAQQCGQRCDVKYAGNAIACNADPTCMYDYTADVCTKTCTALATNVDCEAQSLCSWDANTGKCRKTCQQNLDPTSCAADPTCEWLSARTPSCNKKCVVMYSTPDACKADEYCMWDPTQALCTPTCKYFNPTQCNNNFLCGYDGKAQPAQQCKQLCQYRWPTSVQCNNDTECTWDSVREKCAGQCPLLSSSEPLCLTSDICQYQLGGCVRQCMYRAFTQAECNNGTNAETCYWDPYRKYCVNTCNNYMKETTMQRRQEKCDADPFCEWESNNSTCEKRCQQMNFQNCVDQPDRCLWDRGAGTCKPTCSRLSLATICKADSMCTWNGAQCQLLCNFRHTTKPDCDADSQCSWDTQSGVCVGACALVSDSALCSAREQCRWDATTGTCKDTCRTMSPEMCQTSFSCSFDAATGVCEEKCVTKYSTASACNADPLCMYDDAATQCKPACNGFTAAALNTNNTVEVQQRCLTEQMCTWEVSATVPGGWCTKKCQFAHTDANACDADPRCMYDNARLRCASNCSVLTVRDTCELNAMCQWSNNTCKLQCNVKSQSQCALPCMWNAATSTCSHSCSSHTGQDSCISDSNCWWDPTVNTCKNGCVLYGTATAACKADTRCIWDVEATTCRRKCEIRKSSSCLQLPSICYFNYTSVTCQTRCNVKYGTDRPTCNADPVCNYDLAKGVCKDSCSLTTTGADCNARDMCEWNPVAARCRRRCSQYPTTGECGENPYCEWRSGVCTKKCEYKHTVAQACATDPMCLWDTLLQTCRPTCSRISTSEECSQMPACTWNSTACRRTCANRHQDSDSCNADVDCLWDNQRLQCAPHCSFVMNTLSCNVQPMCMWTTTCVTKCAYAYKTQPACNAADTTKGCLWNSDKARCDNTCNQFTTAATCSASPVCELIRSPVSTGITVGTESYTCNKTCEIKFLDLYSCNVQSQDRCAWDAATQICKRRCETITSYGECTEAQNCDWNVAKRRCDVQCAYAQDCAGRSDCVTDRTTGVCKVSCDARNNPTDCNADADCMWDGRNTVCRQRCEAVFNAKDCMDAAACTWDVATLTCVRHCSNLYPTQPNCIANARCQWDPTSNLCQTACASVYVADPNDPVSRDFCVGQTMCQLNPISSQCETRCRFRADTSAACATFSDCLWDGQANVCDRQCKTIKDMLICAASSMCMVSPANSSICINRCPTRYTEPGPCNNDPYKQCAWEPTIPGCVNVCQFHNNEQECRNDALCNVSAFATTGQCGSTCSTSGYNTRTRCVADVKCEWNPANSICVQACSSTQTQLACEARKDVCEWNLQYRSCNTRCSVKYTTASKCDADPLCAWAANRNICVQSCESQPTAAECDSLSICQWSLQSQSCKRACTTYVNASTCQNNAACQWNALNSTCGTQCAYRYGSNVESCIADVECMYDTVTTTCRMNCRLIPSREGCAVEYTSCEWSTANTCEQKCAAQYTKASGCNSNPRCVWSASIQRCNTRCNQVPVGNMASCVANPQCMYVNNICQDKCSSRSAADCAVPGCTVTGGVCDFTCSGVTNCSATSTCNVTATGSCAVGCRAKYSTELACTSDPNCMWDGRLGVCKPPCPSLTSNPSLCLYDEMCSMINGKCALACQLRHQTMPPCRADPDCLWNGARSFCDSACRTYQDAPSCFTNEQCSWVSQLSLCRRKCAFTPIEQCAANEQCRLTTDGSNCTTKCLARWGANGACNADPECEWNAQTDSCGPRRCTNPVTQGNCTMDSVCNWNNVSNTCGRKPCTWTDALSCAADTVCEWILRNETCVPNLCPYQTTSIAVCNSYPACKWNSGGSAGGSGAAAKLCVKRCDYLGTPQECSDAVGRCEWSFSGTCKETCKDRHNTPTDCDADEDCVWDMKTSGCVKGCPKNANESTCAPEGPQSNCVWKDNTCVVRCDVKYGVRRDQHAPCEADPLCETYTVWTTTGKAYRCGEPCRDVPMAACGGTTAQYCAWVNNTCTGSCRAAYRTPDLCNADMQCQWDYRESLTTIHACEERCDVIQPMDEELCTVGYGGDLGSCRWDAVSSRCVPKCYVKYATESACMADLMCLWRNSTNPPGCDVGCLQMNVAQCLTDPACGMFNGTCSRKCAWRHPDPDSCNSDGDCQWSPREGKCIGKLCRHSFPAPCRSDGCDWVDGQCLQNCSTLAPTDADCGKNRLCLLRNGECVKRCQFRTATAATCNDDFCTTAPGFPNCTERCSLYSTELTCVKAPICRWNSAANLCDKQCRYKVVITGAESQTECLLDDCRLSSSTPPVCEDNRCYATDAATCTQDTACVFRDGTCQISPCDYSTEPACNQDPNTCEWVIDGSDDGRCAETQCPIGLSQAECSLRSVCAYNVTSMQCKRRPCYFQDQAVCEGSGCEWDATVGRCNTPNLDCIYTVWSDWGECSLPCAGGVQFSSRQIFRQALPGGVPCNQDNLTMSRLCNEGVACACTAITDASRCSELANCSWVDGRCNDSPPTGCAAIADRVSCFASDLGCTFIDNANLCVPRADNRCNHPDQPSCEAATSNYCMWVQEATPGSLKYRPGTAGINVFASVATIVTDELIEAVTCSIATNYQRGQDRLHLVVNRTQFPAMTATWLESYGELRITGVATAAAYSQVLAQVLYFTTSSKAVTRQVTWALGIGAHYNMHEGTVIRYFNDPTQHMLSWTQARDWCEGNAYYGALGYLAAIEDKIENDFLTWTIGANGWTAPAK